MIVTLFENGNYRQLNLTMFGKDIISFGRSPECDIVINAEYVSRVHGCFFYEDGQWSIQDLESSFGIYVNNQKIVNGKLALGDVVSIFSPGNEHNYVQFTVNAFEQLEDGNYSNDVQIVNTMRYTEDHLSNESGNPIDKNKLVDATESQSGNNKKSKVIKIGLTVAAAVLIIVGVVYAINAGANKKSANKDATEVAENTTEQLSEEVTTETTTTETTTEATTEEQLPPDVEYRAYVQADGWKDWGKNGDIGGTVGETKRLEAIEIKLSDTKYEGDIEYTTYVQGTGWQGDLSDSSTWCKNGETSGTTDQSKRVEAVCIKLTGELEKKFDIYYRVHAQSYGWMSWACNGEASGTVNYSKRVESIQIVLVEKGEEAPADDFGGVTTAYVEPYAERIITEEEQAYYQYLSNLEANATGRVDGGIFVEPSESSMRVYYWSYVIADFDSNGKKELLIRYENRFPDPDGTDSPFTDAYKFYEYDPNIGTIIELNGIAQYELSESFTCYNNGTITIGEEFYYIVGMRPDYLYKTGIMNDSLDPSGEYKSCEWPIYHQIFEGSFLINIIEGTSSRAIREVTPSEGEQIFSFINPDNELAVTEYKFTRENIEKIIGN